MSERKVLNKYYPPDFDASKLPRVKREKNRQFVIRLMAPFNMRCKTCGEYIYRGKKFNARKEDVIGKMYLGIQIYRFYIKCTKCLAEITFLTNPGTQDYEMENGAIRNFECIRLAEKQAESEAKQQKEEEANNPMKVLENRTRDSRREMAILETLEDLKEINSKAATFDPESIIKANEEYTRQLLRLQEEEDEAEINRIFNKKKQTTASTNNDDDEEIIVSKKFKSEDSNLKLAEDTKPPQQQQQHQQQIKVNLISDNKKLNDKITKTVISSFIKKKPSVTATNDVDQPQLPPQPPQSQPPATNNALTSLFGAYDDDDDESNESESS